MKITDLQNKHGCPKCLLNETSYKWSGGEVEPSYFLRGGYKRLISIPEKDPAEYGAQPMREVVQCAVCGTIWDFDYWWTDRPPLMLKIRAIPEGELTPYFKEVTNLVKQKVKDVDLMPGDLTTWEDTVQMILKKTPAD